MSALNHEVIPVRVPSNPVEIENFERWLEAISAKGGELVSTIAGGPTGLLCVFRAREKVAGTIKPPGS
jgi:hypothetical protein